MWMHGSFARAKFAYTGTMIRTAVARARKRCPLSDRSISATHVVVRGSREHVWRHVRRFIFPSPRHRRQDLVDSEQTVVSGSRLSSCIEGFDSSADGVAHRDDETRERLPRGRADATPTSQRQAIAHDPGETL
jgi:hypothetical protein